MNPALKWVREHTVSVRLITGETGTVTQMVGGEWYVTLDGERTIRFQHDPTTGVSICECGRTLTCLHREAVWRVVEGRPLAPVIR